MNQPPVQNTFLQYVAIPLRQQHFLSAVLLQDGPDPV